MRRPPNRSGAYIAKLVTLQALSAVLNKHVTMSGEFVVITPGQILHQPDSGTHGRYLPHPEDAAQKPVSARFHLAPDTG